jgi:hypothetical protein
MTKPDYPLDLVLAGAAAGSRQFCWRVAASTRYFLCLLRSDRHAHDVRAGGLGVPAPHGRLRLQRQRGGTRRPVLGLARAARRRQDQPEHGHGKKQADSAYQHSARRETRARLRNYASAHFGYSRDMLCLRHRGPEAEP